MIRPIGQMMGVNKVVLIIAFLACATGVRGAQDRSPIFLGVVSDKPDEAVFLYSTSPQIIKNSRVAYLQMNQGKYSCCFRVGNVRSATSGIPVQDEMEKPVGVYPLTKDKSIIKSLPTYGIVFGAALKRGAHVQKISETNYLVRYGKRKAKLRICTSIESIHFYFQEEGAGEPITHLYYPLDYGVDPTCEEDIKALQQTPSKP